MTTSGKKYIVTRSYEAPARDKSYLHSLDLEITERCNLACLHCGINKGVRDVNAANRELKSAEIKKILKEAADLGCRTLKITGGEPLIRDDFADIYLYAHNLKLKVILFTNATLINQEIVNVFRKSPLLEKIEITLYGMNNNSFEAVTGNRGAFSSTFDGIELLNKYEIPLSLKFALLPQNRADVNDFEKYHAQLSGQSSSPPSYVMFFSKRVRRDSRKKNLSIENARISPQDSIKFCLKQIPDYFKNLPKFLAQTAGPQGKRLFGCGAGRGHGSIDAYGGLSPCLLLKDPNFTYDLRRGTLRDAITNFFPLWRETLAEDSCYHERCAQCFLKSLCEQCPAKAWIENGKVDHPVTYFCQSAHAQAEHLGLLAPGEPAWLVKNWKERINQLMILNDPE